MHGARAREIERKGGGTGPDPVPVSVLRMNLDMFVCLNLTARKPATRLTINPVRKT